MDVVKIFSHKDKNPMIVGFQRCGQNSLVEYLSEEYDDVQRTELLHDHNGIRRFKEQYIDKYFPVIITRNRVDAIWSRYWYFGFNERMTLAEYLCQNNPGVSPLFETDFEFHKDRWKHLGLKIYKMEELTHLTEFPCFNKNKNVAFRNIVSRERDLINSVIRNYEHKFIITYEN